MSSDSKASRLQRTTPAAGLPAEGPRRCGRKPSPEKRLKIMEAAVRLFTTRDYHQVLMDHIAEEAGVGKGTLYRYFQTKEELFLELIHLAVNRASEVITQSTETGEGSQPAIQRLRRAVAITLEYFRRNEPLLEILHHDRVFRCCRERKDLEQKRVEVREHMARLLAQGIAEGSVRSDVEPALAAVMLMFSIRGVLHVFGASRTSEQLAEQVLAIFVEGVASPATGLAKPEPLRALEPEVTARLDPIASLVEMAEGDASEVSEAPYPEMRPALGPEILKHIPVFESGEFVQRDRPDESQEASSAT